MAAENDGERKSKSRRTRVPEEDLGIATVNLSYIFSNSTTSNSQQHCQVVNSQFYKSGVIPIKSVARKILNSNA